jgi:superfamily II DNA helicase RecQ
MSDTEMKKLGGRSRTSVLQKFIKGDLRVLFTTPEQAFSNSCKPYIKEMLAKNKISRIVIDEAHLLRQWEGFRANFQNFGDLRSCFKGVPLLLMTACLPRETRSHLSSQIGFSHVMINRCEANRRNAFYMVQRKICDCFEGVNAKKDEFSKIRGPTLDRLVALLRGPFLGASAIIYCRTTTLTAILSKFLRQNICENAARHFHSQMPHEERSENQRHWTESTVPVMVATCAFGLGINHPHVRLIVHWDMPQTLDDYFQQAGRAGRDGAPCLILSFFHSTDLDGTLNLGVSQPHRAIEVASFMENQVFCRRASILSEYAEPLRPNRCKTSCDVCFYQKTWSLYDISRFANSLLALVLYLPHHIEPLHVKKFPFKWLVTLLRGDIKAVKTSLTNSNSATLCKTGIVPGCGSMKNLCNDDAFTILLSLFEHGVFKVTKQESKQFAKGLQSHMWKIEAGDDVFKPEDMKSCISESCQRQRLVKPRYQSMLIPLPAVTIQRLQRPVGGEWNECPDHGMFCGWCKDRCFTDSSTDQVRPFVCAPILAHKECIDDEHDDEENKRQYDDAENCMLCRNVDVHEGRKQIDKSQLIICSLCNKGTCSYCLKTIYELDEDAIKILTTLESAKWSCANCDPYTIPTCYQWYRVEKTLESRRKGYKDNTIPKRNEPLDLLSLLLQQPQTLCERALKYSETNLSFMEDDLQPLVATSTGEFPLFSFVTFSDFVDSVQNYFMVMSQSSADEFVYAVEFVVNARSNALQPPKPNLHELFDEKLLLRLECNKIKQIRVETKQIFELDGTSNVWCPLNTINKLRRELLAKINAKQKYMWTHLNILAQSEIESKGPSSFSSQPASNQSVEEAHVINAADDKKQPKRTVVNQDSLKNDPKSKQHLPLLMKRHANIEESSASKIQKVVEMPSKASSIVKSRSKFLDALHRTSNDSNFFFDKKDAKISCDVLIVSMLSHVNCVIPIDAEAVRFSEGSLAGNEYGRFSIHHVIFIALYQAALPVRSSDIAVIIQSMGFGLVYSSSSSFSSVIQNTLANHHRDFPGGIFQCSKHYWFLNPRTKMQDVCRVRAPLFTRASLANGLEPPLTEPTSFGRCLNIKPGTFLRVIPEKKVDDEDWYCMVTEVKDTGQWFEYTSAGIKIYVRWFEELKKDAHIKYGAKELIAFEGGTERAWDKININSIKEVVFVRWGLPEPHELNWFEFYYTKNINFLTLPSGKKERCVSPCNPMRYLEDFWDEDLLEFHNPDPYASMLYHDPQNCEDIFDKSILRRNSVESSVKCYDGTQDRTQLHLICARTLMSRHYSHPSSTKMNIRNCHLHEYADLFEAVIFALLQNQLPMSFQTLCDKIGVRSKFRSDLQSYCKNALSPDVFWVDTIIDVYGHRSKDDYISLKIWEVAFDAFRKSDCEGGAEMSDKIGREGVSWKRAFVAVSKIHSKASVLYKCAIIANKYPALCEQHLKSSAVAAHFLYEISIAMDLESPFSCEQVSTDPEALKIVRWGVLSRDIMQKSARKNRSSLQPLTMKARQAPKFEASSTAAAVDCILVTSDDEPSLEVIDIDELDDSDEEQFCEISSNRKRPFPANSESLQLLSRDKELCKKLAPDEQIALQFALMFCFKGLQSNLTFQLSTIRDKILQLFPQYQNVLAIAEIAVHALQERNILVFNSSLSHKECDPSPCFHLNMDKGLVTSVSDHPIAHADVKHVVQANDSFALSSSKGTVNNAKLSRNRYEFFFVAPPQCQSFQDQKVFLRSSVATLEVSTANVTQFTSMYSRFNNLETAISYLTQLEEDETNHACRHEVHPIIQLVQGKIKNSEPQENEDDDDLLFEEPVLLGQDDDVNPEAFKPYCRRPDPNILDFRKKFEMFCKFDFEVGYWIEHFISCGGLFWNSLDHQDLQKMEQYSNELVDARKSSARDTYSQVINKIKVQLSNKINLEKMKGQVDFDKVVEETILQKQSKNKVERKKVSTEDIQAMERCTVFSGVFHECRGVKLKPSVYGKFSCRAFRKFGSDRFITVSIPRNVTTQKLRCLLDHGFKTVVGDRLYRFIPSGDGHLKERKLMFFAVSGQMLDPFLPQSFLQWHIPMSRDPFSEYFSNSDIISIKFFARFQLCFSASAVAMTLATDEYEFCDDIELEVPEISKKVCATDGCGRAPPEFFVKVQRAFKLDYVPSCVQIRFGGCKGLLHVDTSVSKVQFRRKSQRKYVFDDAAIDQRQIEITSWSPSHRAATSDMTAKLNLQLAFVLRSMGVPDEFFFSLLQDTRELVLGAIGKGSPDKLHRDAALDFVRKFKGMPQCEQIREILEQDILDVTHPYVIRGLKFAIDLLLNPIQSSFHMPVPEMKFLYGVPDPTGILEYGQCFVFLGEAADGAVHRRFEDTEVLVGRNPMQHPGDVRKLIAVFVQELYNMKLVNVIVFPVKGNPKTGQLLNDEMSGGDFDGDQYIFIWNREITKHAKNHDPYPYYLDGNPLAKMSSSVACSSSLDSPNELISSTTQLLNTSTCDVFDTTSSALALSSELSDQRVFDVLLSNGEPSDRPDFTPESAGLTAPLSYLQNSIEPTEGSSLQQNSVASSDPSKWTSDDVKGLFSSKIGSCSEEAYEKLKLCALGVLCHWDNSLGKIPALLLSPKLLIFSCQIIVENVYH